ncbi:MAG: hypothetical protein IPJ41_10620 [Phycisphaerales bacterium]|nr:hypothetical protein [Phycisphaerales bacterium]
MTEQLRQIIRSDKRPPAHIADAAGLNKSILSRFLAGSSLSSDNFDRLAALYDLKLTKRRKGY